MSRGWAQVRIRLPEEVLENIRNAARRRGVSDQQEIFARIQRGSSERAMQPAAELGRFAGQVEAAIALHKSLGATLENMASRVLPESE